MTTQDKPAVGPLSAGDVLRIDNATRVHVPELEQSATNQRPKTRDWRETKLYRYAGTDLYQWFGKRNGSVFEDPSEEPFVIRLVPTAPVETLGETAAFWGNVVAEPELRNNPDFWCELMGEALDALDTIASAEHWVEVQPVAIYAQTASEAIRSKYSILNPQPDTGKVEAGGVEREPDLLRRAKGMKALGAHSITVRIDELEAALRPQPSGETRERLKEMAEWLKRGDPGSEGSVLLSASVAAEHSADLLALIATADQAKGGEG